MCDRGYRRQALERSILAEIKRKGEEEKYIVGVFLIEGKTVEEKLKTLNRCECCERHKINRPEGLDLVSVSVSVKNSNGKDNETITCKCDCRHLARLICYNPSVCNVCLD